jgi:hypothetical protein
MLPRTFHGVNDLRHDAQCTLCYSRYESEDPDKVENDAARYQQSF